MAFYRKVKIFINHESHKSYYPEYIRNFNDKRTLLKRGQIIRADLSNNIQIENKCLYSLRKR